jgi:hypothetical protein
MIITQAMYAIRENLAHLTILVFWLKINAEIMLETSDKVMMNDMNDIGSSTPDVFI